MGDKKQPVAHARSKNAQARADAAAAEIRKLEQDCIDYLDNPELDKHTANARVAHCRQMIEDRKWEARIYNPKKYRENIAISGDEANPLRTVTELVVRRVGGTK